eukprot:jgi/Chlat1/3858/Chrsp26S04148
MMKRGSRGRGAKGGGGGGGGSGGGGGLLGTSSSSTKSASLSISRSFIRYLLLAVAACSFITTFVLLKPSTLYDVGANKEYFSSSVLGDFGQGGVESAGARDVASIEEDDTDSFLSIPEVTTIAPFHSPAAGGDQIVIHGHNLRSRTGEATVTAAVGKRNCTETRWGGLRWVM